jgi:hypothetical protein
MPRRHHAPGSLHRVFATLCAVLVLGLMVLAASPTAHNWLHSGTPPHTCSDHAKSKPVPAPSEHDCAVVLFASGVDTPLAAITLSPPRLIARNVSPVTAAAFYLVSPRYLRQPERGPPSSELA